MSTSFEVYPAALFVPTYAELMNDANQMINAYLAEIGIFRKIALSVQKMDKGKCYDINIHDKMLLLDTMALFRFSGLEGVCGANCHRTMQFWDNEAAYKDFWITDNRNKKNFGDFIEPIDKNIKIGYYWSFTRWAGAPALINLAYGMLAASMAKLSGGFIYSDDGAWDFECFPAWPNNFIQWYLKAEYTNTEKEWVQGCISEIQRELST